MVFSFLRLRCGLRLNPARDVWRGCDSGITTDSAWSSSLCLQDLRLKRSSLLSSSSTVSVSVHNMGWDLFYPMWRVSSIATSSSPIPSEGETRLVLGVSVCFSLMWYKPSLIYAFSTCTGPKAGSAMTNSLIRRSNDRLYCMVDRAAIGNVLAFML